MPKPALTIAEQVDLLASRGLDLDEGRRLRLARLLMSNNYYRLSGYWRYFQVAPHLGDDRFRPDASLEMIEDVYRFDAMLRRIAATGLADLEVAFRSRLAYALAVQSSPVHHLDRGAYSDETGREGTQHRDDLLGSVQRELERSREDYVLHHLRRGEQVPIWAAVEALGFGTVSKLYRLVRDQDVRYQVARSFGLDPERTESMSRAFAVFRNVCAHHGRIWNRVPAISLQVPRELQVERDRTVYRQSPWGLLVTLAWLVDGIRRDTSFSSELWRHVDAHPRWLDGLQRPHRR